MADPDLLRAQMQRCRRLARGVDDDRANRELLDMARELEGQLETQPEIAKQAAIAEPAPLEIPAAPPPPAR